MEPFVVSARKYRPLRFEDVVGQAHVAGTLKNALATGQVAHAFLFTGPRGVGKTTCARILAKVLNCQNRSKDFEACNECGSCRGFNESASFNIFELDAASNSGVENIRALVEQVRIPPQQGKYKVFILDEVHMLSTPAFNAFLKTLEEPPPHAIFILATTEKHKIIPTILSRCQIFDFRRITVADMVLHLGNICKKEGIEADEDALHIIAQKADGALRDALSIFDRIGASTGATRKIRYDDVIENLNVLDYDYYFQITDSLLGEDLAGVLNLFDQIQRKGFEPDTFVNGLAEHLRNILVCKDAATLALLETGEKLRERYRRQAALAPVSFLLTALGIANDCDIHYKMARHKRLHVEMALIKMTFAGRAIEAAKTGASLAIPEKKTLDVRSDGGQVLEKGVDGRASAISAEPRAQNLAVPPPVQNPPVENFGPPKTPGDFQVQISKTETPPGPRKLGLGNATALTLDAFEAAVAEEEAEEAGRESRLTFENARMEWLAFALGRDSQTLKMAMQHAEISIEDGTVLVAKVASSTQKNLILAEQNRLLDHLRAKLHDRRAQVRIDVDEEKAEAFRAANAPKKTLSTKEKWEMMKAANPLVQDLVEKFELRAESE